MHRINNNIFITGGTGYIGKAVIKKLLAEGYNVTALTREKSAHKLPAGCNVVVGNALDANSYVDKIAPAETFIHLVGAAHPGPGKEKQFDKIDKVSIEQSVKAAKSAGIKHFIYLSIAHPAPIMQHFIDVRISGEKLIKENGMKATFVRPWYVLGPGHRWPYPLVPVLKLMEYLPHTSNFAKRLAFVNLNQISSALVNAVKNVPEEVRILEPLEIREFC